MRLLSAGAARTVTGSCHLIEARGRRILVDCGLFQGRDVEARNREPFPFEPDSVDVVLLTHAHLDHVGRLPLLVNRGFGGRIYATRSTRAVAEVILLDAANLQQEDHARALKRAREAGEAEDVPQPLYVPGDIPEALSLVVSVEFDERLDLGGGVRVRFRPACHILGSAFVEIESSDGRVIFSGDLGSRENAIHAVTPLPSECDDVIVETTYADRNHRSRAETEAEFCEVLGESLAAGGNVLIPSFALERSQVVLYEIRRLMRAGRLPRARVFLDSPMAASMTKLYQQCAGECRREVAEELHRGVDPFEPEGLEFSVSTEESKAINAIEGGAIIIAGSGMMTGGRILHHLKRELPRKESSLVVVGYQSESTLGRRLVDGAKVVRIHGREVEVRARVATINGFSAHADRDDLVRWIEATGRARVHLVHGEPPVMESFARVLADAGREAAVVPDSEWVELDGA